MKKRVPGENVLILKLEIDELRCFEYRNAKTSKSKILLFCGFETQLAKFGIQHAPLDHIKKLFFF